MQHEVSQRQGSDNRGAISSKMLSEASQPLASQLDHPLEYVPPTQDHTDFSTLGGDVGRQHHTGLPDQAHNQASHHCCALKTASLYDRCW